MTLLKKIKMEKYHQKIPIEHYIIETLTKPLHCSVTEETPMPLFLDGIEHCIIETPTKPLYSIAQSQKQQLCFYCRILLLDLHRACERGVRGYIAPRSGRYGVPGKLK